MKRRNANKQSTGEEGQALLLILLAVSLVLCGAVGLAIDASQMYAQRQMAQAAADAAAQAAMVSVLNGTNTLLNYNNAFGTSGTINCSGNTALTPCYYANLNGFGPTYGDTVTVAFPTSVPRVVGLATDISPNLVSVTITRSVNTTLMQFLGSSLGSVVGHGTAAILSPTSGAPIIVTHPSLANAISLSGGSRTVPSITIVNGPSLSIQVNSCAGDGGTASNGQSCQSVSSISDGSDNIIDLSKAGPSGNGGTFGNWGAPTAWPGCSGCLLPATTAYKDPSSVQADPLSGIQPPSQPTGAAVITNPTPTASNVAPNPCLVVLPPATPNPCQGTSTYGCPPGTTNGCVLFYPGYYATPISMPTTIRPHVFSALFAPGLYYIGSGDTQSTGLQLSGSSTAAMATGFAPDANTGTGMTVFLTGGAVLDFQNGAAATLTGDTVGTYGGMLFFKDRNDACKESGGSGVCAHQIIGDGGINLTGTIYLTRDSGATNAQYNQLLVQNSGGSNTSVTGEIIVDTLLMSGKPTITITLPPSSGIRQVHQIALVQ